MFRFGKSKNEESKTSAPPAAPTSTPISSVVAAADPKSLGVFGVLSSSDAKKRGPGGVLALSGMADDSDDEWSDSDEVVPTVVPKKSVSNKPPPPVIKTVVSTVPMTSFKSGTGFSLRDPTLDSDSDDDSAPVSAKATPAAPKPAVAPASSRPITNSFITSNGGKPTLSLKDPTLDESDSDDSFSPPPKPVPTMKAAPPPRPIPDVAKSSGKSVDVSSGSRNPSSLPTKKENEVSRNPGTNATSSSVSMVSAESTTSGSLKVVSSAEVSKKVEPLPVSDNVPPTTTLSTTSSAPPPTLLSRPSWRSAKPSSTPIVTKQVLEMKPSFIETTNSAQLSPNSAISSAISPAPPAAVAPSVSYSSTTSFPINHQGNIPPGGVQGFPTSSLNIAPTPSIQSSFASNTTNLTEEPIHGVKSSVDPQLQKSSPIIRSTSLGSAQSLSFQQFGMNSPVVMNTGAGLYQSGVGIPLSIQDIDNNSSRSHSDPSFSDSCSTFVAQNQYIPPPQLNYPSGGNSSVPSPYANPYSNPQTNQAMPLLDSTVTKILERRAQRRNSSANNEQAYQKGRAGGSDALLPLNGGIPATRISNSALSHSTIANGLSAAPMSPAATLSSHMAHLHMNVLATAPSIKPALSAPILHTSSQPTVSSISNWSTIGKPRMDQQQSMIPPSVATSTHAGGYSGSGSSSIQSGNLSSFSNIGLPSRSSALPYTAAVNIASRSSLLTAQRIALANSLSSGTPSLPVASSSTNYRPNSTSTAIENSFNFLGKEDLTEPNRREAIPKTDKELTLVSPGSNIVQTLILQPQDSFVTLERLNDIKSPGNMVSKLSVAPTSASILSPMDSELAAEIRRKRIEADEIVRAANEHALRASKLIHGESSSDGDFTNSSLREKAPIHEYADIQHDDNKLKNSDVQSVTSKLVKPSVDSVRFSKSNHEYEKLILFSSNSIQNNVKKTIQSISPSLDALKEGRNALLCAFHAEVVFASVSNQTPNIHPFSTPLDNMGTAGDPGIFMTPVGQPTPAYTIPILECLNVLPISPTVLKPELPVFASVTGTNYGPRFVVSYDRPTLLSLELGKAGILRWSLSPLILPVSNAPALDQNRCELPLFSMKSLTALPQLNMTSIAELVNLKKREQMVLQQIVPPNLQHLHQNSRTSMDEFRALMKAHPFQVDVEFDLPVPIQLILASAPRGITVPEDGSMSDHSPLESLAAILDLCTYPPNATHIVVRLSKRYGFTSALERDSMLKALSISHSLAPFPLEAGAGLQWLSGSIPPLPQTTPLCDAGSEQWDLVDMERALSMARADLRLQGSSALSGAVTNLNSVDGEHIPLTMDDQRALLNIYQRGNILNTSVESDDSSSINSEPRDGGYSNENLLQGANIVHSYKSILKPSVPKSDEFSPKTSSVPPRVVTQVSPTTYSHSSRFTPAISSLVNSSVESDGSLQSSHSAPDKYKILSRESTSHSTYTNLVPPSNKLPHPLNVNIGNSSHSQQIVPRASISTPQVQAFGSSSDVPDSEDQMVNYGTEVSLSRPNMGGNTLSFGSSSHLSASSSKPNFNLSNRHVDSSSIMTSRSSSSLFGNGKQLIGPRIPTRK